MIRACTTPPSRPEMIKLPKRVARARRVMESKRLDSFREVHEALKKTAKEEQKFIRDFFDRMKKLGDDEEKEEETEPESNE